MSSNKQVIIADLPPGYFKEQLVKFVIDPKTTLVWVVAVAGDGLRDWSAYIGHPDIELVKDEYRENFEPYKDSYLNTPAGVRRVGDKLSEEEARALFPGVTLLYRS